MSESLREFFQESLGVRLGGNTFAEILRLRDEDPDARVEMRGRDAASGLPKTVTVYLPDLPTG